MSTTPPPAPPDTITITCVRPSKNQTITVTIPASMVTLLDWLAANVKNPDGTAKYLYGLNVLWQDAITYLVPMWQQEFAAGQVAPLQAQIDAANQAVASQVSEGLTGLTVVGP